VLQSESIFKVKTVGAITLPPIAFNAKNGARWLACASTQGFEFVAENDTSTQVLIPRKQLRPAAWLKSISLAEDTQPLILTFLPDTGLMAVDWQKKTLVHWPDILLKGTFSTPPISFRLGNSQYIAIANEAGSLYLVNEKGRLVPGFPVEAETRVLTQLFAKPGNTGTDSYLFALSEYGGLNRWNVDGNFIDKLQITRPNKDCQFALINDAQGHGFVVARFAGEKLDFFRPNAEAMGGSIPAAGEKPDIQYYQFGGGKEVVILTYPKTGRTYLYNGKLQKLTMEPLANRFPVSLLFNSRTGKYTIYTTTEKGIAKLTLK